MQLQQLLTSGIETHSQRNEVEPEILKIVEFSAGSFAVASALAQPVREGMITAFNKHAKVGPWVGDLSRTVSQLRVACHFM